MYPRTSPRLLNTVLWTGGTENTHTHTLHVQSGRSDCQMLLMISQKTNMFAYFFDFCALRRDFGTFWGPKSGKPDQAWPPMVWGWETKDFQDLKDATGQKFP